MLCFDENSCFANNSEIGTYSETRITVNTWNILGMFIVLWPVTVKISHEMQATHETTM